ncbi:unnamed protein product [Camellia sinensis]
MNLRGDDPATMKYFDLSVQNRANELKASSTNGQANTSSKKRVFVCIHVHMSTFTFLHSHGWSCI